MTGRSITAYPGAGEELMKRLKVILVSQEDGFFLPGVIEQILNAPEVKVSSIVLVDSGGALKNRKLYFLRQFGLAGSLRLIYKYLGAELLDKIDRLTGYLLLKEKRSLKGLAKKYGLPCPVVRNINSAEVYGMMAQERPHLILSFSAPQVFKEPLLSLPRYGLLNVHGSLLPDYRGIMPGFWVLANGEKFSGATIHRMSGDIDEGEILFQESVDISKCKTMFEVIGKTKEKGGEIALRALNCFCSHPEEVIFKPNLISEGRYFSWPQKEDVTRFFDRGFRLV